MSRFQIESIKHECNNSGELVVVTVKDTGLPQDPPNRNGDIYLLTRTYEVAVDHDKLKEFLERRDPDADVADFCAQLRRILVIERLREL